MGGGGDLQGHPVVENRGSREQGKESPPTLMGGGLEGLGIFSAFLRHIASKASLRLRVGVRLGNG